MIYLIFFVFWHTQLYMSWYIRSFFGFTFLNILYFFKYSCTNIFHRRSLYTFYSNNPSNLIYLTCVSVIYIVIKSHAKQLQWNEISIDFELRWTKRYLIGPTSHYLKWDQSGQLLLSPGSRFLVGHMPLISWSTHSLQHLGSLLRMGYSSCVALQLRATMPSEASHNPSGTSLKTRLGLKGKGNPALICRTNEYIHQWYMVVICASFIYH